MPAATPDKLSSLHDALADKMAALLRGEEVPASVLKEVREFLKDNGINCDGKKSQKVSGIAQTLPFVTPQEATG